jgi:chitodextrinase
MKFVRYLFLAVLISLCGILAQSVHAQQFNKDLSINANSVRTSGNILVGKSIRIYATVTNNSGQDLIGVVKFYDENKKSFIGSDQPVSILAGKTDDVFIDWVGQSIGNHPISIRVIPWSEEGDDPNNNKVTKNIYVDTDSDGDGLGDLSDSDDDNDGVPDVSDAFPLDPAESLDSDNDGIGNNADTDDDNDGVPDVEDAFPLNAGETKDSDGDGVGDNSDKFPTDPKDWTDSDNDGLGDNSDPDNANKGPIPKIGVDDTVVSKGRPVAFNALGSNDPDGQVVSYEWDFGDGETAKGVIVDHIFANTGEYNVKLKVTDDKGEPREQELVVKVVYKWQAIALVIVTFLLALLILIKIITFWTKKMNKRGSEKSFYIPAVTTFKKSVPKKGLPKKKK